MAARVREEDQGDALAMIAQPANLDSPLLAVVQRVDSDHSVPSGDYTGPEAGESQDAAVVGQVSQPAYILTRIQLWRCLWALLIHLLQFW